MKIEIDKLIEQNVDMSSMAARNFAALREMLEEDKKDTHLKLTTYLEAIDPFYTRQTKKLRSSMGGQ